jgi:homoserine kinase type II
MAAKTQFSADELRLLLADYDLGEYVSHKSFEEGTDQTNLLLETSRGKYAFRYYEKRPRNYALFEIDVLK